jgi:bifunctional DNA-binding transcriptional regulator/antitoxin component of YhaV-PrlF toxin-antitoxin module
MVYKAQGIDETDDVEITIMGDKVRFVISNLDDIQGLSVSIISFQSWKKILNAMKSNEETVI